MKDHPNLRKLFWINFLNNTFWLSSVATFFYLQRGLSYSQILTLGAILSVAILFSEVPTGVFADKFGKKKSLILSSIMYIISMSIYLFASNFLTFVISFIVLGIGVAFSSGTIEALIYESLRETKKQSTMHIQMGRFFSAEVLAGVIIPPIASLIAKSLTPMQFLILVWLTIGCYVLALVLIIFLHEPKLKEKNNTYHLTKKAIIYAIKHKKILGLALSRILAGLALSLFMYLWQPYLKDANVPIYLLGILLSIGSLGIFIVNRSITKIERILTPNTILIGSMTLVAVLFFLTGITSLAIFAVLLYLLIRIIAAIREPFLSHELNKHILSEQRATTLSFFSMIGAVIGLVLRPIVGFIADINIHYSLVILGIICFAATIICPRK